MKVIFESPRILGIALLPNGREIHGLLQFQAIAFEPAEEGSVLPNGRAPDSAAQWLKQVNQEGSVVIGPPSHHPGLNPIAIPAARLRDLAPDTGVVMEWTMEPFR
jgi:hypothetical protein